MFKKFEETYGQPPRAKQLERFILWEQQNNRCILFRRKRLQKEDIIAGRVFRHRSCFCQLVEATMIA